MLSPTNTDEQSVITVDKDNEDVSLSIMQTLESRQPCGVSSCSQWILRPIYALNEQLYRHKFPISDFRTRTKFKTLLLGCGHSGKSTIFKQLTSIYDGSLNGDEFSGVAKDIQHRIVLQMKYMLQHLKNADDDSFVFGAFSSTEFQDAARRLNSDQPLIAMKNDISYLWGLPMIKKFWTECADLGIAHSTKDFLDDLDRIANDDYRPTKEDIFKVRIPTMGIMNKDISVNNCVLNVYEVGGVRTERRKWIHCFENVNCMVFVVSLAHFDQYFHEQNKVNAMQEQLDLFDCFMNIYHQRYFRNSEVLLLFTFTDLFDDLFARKRDEFCRCFPHFNPNASHIRIADVFLSGIAETLSQKVIIPQPVVRLCAAYFGGSDLSLFVFAIARRFVIDRFKEKVPSELIDSVHVRSICALNKAEVKTVFDELPDILGAGRPPITAFNYALHIAKKIGLKEIKILFPSTVCAAMVMSIIFICVPYDVLSYLELTVSSLLMICTLMWFCYGFWKQDGDDVIVVILCPCLWMIIVISMWPLNFIVTKVDVEPNSVWTSIVYIVFPLCVWFIYFLWISIKSFYWFWHQIWILIWFGIMMIVIGKVDTDIAGDGAWIIGICAVAAALFVPWVAKLYLNGEDGECRCRFS